MTRCFLWFVALFALATVPISAQTIPPELIRYPDLIFHNGKIVTMDDKSNSTVLGTVVEALAVRDGKILALGSKARFFS